MPKYNLSSVPDIKQSALDARNFANQEPNQSGYNAAWLHGYADALKEVGEQLTPPPTVVAQLRKVYADVVAALNEAETEYNKNRKSVSARQNYYFAGAQEQVLRDLAGELGVELHDDDLNLIPAAETADLEVAATGHYLNLFSADGTLDVFVIFNEANSEPTVEEIDKLQTLVDQHIIGNASEKALEKLIEDTGLECVKYGVQVLRTRK